MKLAIIGTGYVGIVTAAVFADFGNQVCGLDVDKSKIESLKLKNIPFYEPGLKELVERNVDKKRLKFTTSYKEALKNAEIIFICVGTPQKLSGEAELSYVFEAVKSIAKNLKNGAIVVIKSTMPPGTHQEIKKVMARLSKVKFSLASVPEFLREGSAIADTLKPSRIVIGTEDKKTVNKLLDLHAPINGKRVICDIVSAQMIKYAANAFLAAKISFANAVARICGSLGADCMKVMEGIGLDPRIGREFLYPGLGYGGSCFPKDVKAFYFLSKKAGYNFQLLDEVNQINDTQTAYVVEKTEEIIKSFSGKTVGILGLAFKPNTDDMREARSLVLIDLLLKKNAKIQAYDPEALEQAKKMLGKKIAYKKGAYEAVKGADVVFVVTEWNEFKKLDFKKIKTLMRGNLLIDGRNIYDPEIVRKSGLAYLGVGRK